MGNDSEIEKSAWNLSMQLIQNISDLIAQGSRKLLTGDCFQSYIYFREIISLIYYDLSPEEVKAVDEIGNKIGRVQFGLRQLGFEDEEEIHKLKNKQYVLFTAYRRLIFSYLGKYGYLVGKQKDTTSIF